MDEDQDQGASFYVSAGRAGYLLGCDNAKIIRAIQKSELRGYQDSRGRWWAAREDVERHVMERRDASDRVFALSAIHHGANGKPLDIEDPEQRAELIRRQIKTLHPEKDARERLNLAIELRKIEGVNAADPLAAPQGTVTIRRRRLGDER